jgi:hypothetical protein
MVRAVFYFACVGMVVTGLMAAKPSSGTAEPWAPPLPPTIDFNRDIRPILSDNCFYCHGPDKNHRKADLRLDTKEGLLADLGGYSPAVPGKPDESEMIRRIVSTDPDEVMPPPDTHKKLQPREVALIRKWIEQGVDFKGHWLYIPPTRPPVPAIKGRFVKNDIDRFILARLRSERLEPSREADRATLIRRLSFDLTGLPPAPQQVDAFVSDTRPDAYERLVESLLSSPHYGERMAIHWLDLVRFADTVGYHGDRPMNVWPYRDYIIKAFNDNMPFDRFTIEQLAGDLLPNPTVEQKVAAGYNRLLMISEEGGIQDKEYRIKYDADRVRNVSQVWMGSTIGCSQCHDHKFDPFAAKDFYQMAAFFADIKEFGYYGGRNADGNWGEFIFVPTKDQEKKLAELDASLAEARADLAAQTAERSAAQSEWERTSLEKAFKPLQLLEATSENGAELKRLEDGSILASETAGERDTYTLTLSTDLAGINAFRLEVLPDPSLPGHGPGRGSTGNFVLSEFEVFVQGTKVPLADPTATFSQEGLPVTGAIDGNEKTGWAIAPRFAVANSAVFQTAQPVGDGSALTLTVRLRQLHGYRHVIGRFRITATTGARPNTADQMPDAIAAILAIDASRRTPEQQAAVAAHFRAVSPLMQPQRQKIAELEKQRKEFAAAIPTMQVTVSTEPRTIRVLPRGNWMDESGEIVQPGVPHFLPQIQREGRATRLDLAHWLVRPDNAFTSRVFVNRLWAMAFGAGLSRNLSDMGSQGEWPTHPQLLDWLAVEFVESGWDVKHMMRLIVSSGAYRQSSLVAPQLRERDPGNRLLARQSRFRLDAEMIRDNALAVSGLLVRDLYGASAKPYQPAGYYAYLNFPVREYQADTGAGLYRRGVYTWWQRQYLHPALLAFDAPSREECTAERPRSNTPLQALVLLNDPSYVEAARVFAERIMREGGAAADAWIAWAMRHVLSRPATAKEIELLSALYRSHLAQYQQSPSDAAELLDVGDRKPAEDLDPAELAAWTSVARALLNLNETITRS